MAGSSHLGTVLEVPCPSALLLNSSVLTAFCSQSYFCGPRALANSSRTVPSREMASPLPTRSHVGRMTLSVMAALPCTEVERQGAANRWGGAQAAPPRSLPPPFPPLA